MTNDDGSGETGDLMTKTWWTELMDLIDSQIASQGSIITTDTTYYVSDADGDDANDGSVSAPWATLSHAIASLSPYRIQPGVVCTIQLDDGVYAETSAIEHLPAGVTLAGKNTYTRTMTSVQSSSGVAGNYSIIINLDSVTNISTSDTVLITGYSGGTNGQRIVGCWDVTNVDTGNTRITVGSSNYDGVPSGAVTATVTVIKSTISCVGCSGVVDAPITLKNLVLRGDGTSSTYGISSTQAPVNIEGAVGIRGFGTHGISVSDTGNVSGDPLVISDCGANGIQAARGGTIKLDGSTISGNGFYGLLSQGGASLDMRSGIVTGNSGHNVYCRYNSSMDILASVIIGASAAYAERYGYILAQGWTVSGTVSPAVNTQGNEYGYIDS